MENRPLQPSSDSSQPQRLEIAHVLFADIVGYSRLPMDQQTRLLRQLQDIVRSTREFQDAISRDQLITLPTGDGMALVFFGSPEDPVRCALDISRALGAQPELKLRMGVHSGPVFRVADINASLNVAGGAINMAQRVMDCGDAGHILVSDAIATTLEQLGTWGAQLHDLGETVVKHGTRVHIYNLFTDDLGNAELPAKFRRRGPRTAIVVGVVPRRRDSGTRAQPTSYARSGSQIVLGCPSRLRRSRHASPSRFLGFGT